MHTKLHLQHFATGKNISPLISSVSKEFFLFFLESCFIKALYKPFSWVCVAWHKHSRGWKNSQQLCKPSTLTLVCITVLNSPSPSPVYTSDANTENIPRLITLTKTLIISDLTKTESNNTNIIIVLLCFEENNVKHNLGWIRVKLTLLLEIMHCIYKQTTD